MTISYRLAVYEPDGALRGYLTDHTSWDASFPFNDVGGLTVSVPQAYAALAAVPCEIAVEAAFESQPSAPFEETTSGRFVVEQSEVERTAGDAAQVKLTGRGYGALMDGAVVIPARYGSAANYDEDGKRKFLSATPGQILRTVLAEARSLVDGLRPGLTLAFTDTKDTLGVAWSKRMTISYEPGTSLLTVLDNMAAQGMVDWAMVGRSLFVWNPDSRAVESGRRIDIGLTEAPARASAAGLIHTAFLVGEKATWREDNTAGTPTPWGRSMTVLNQGGVSVEATARQLAGAALRAGSRIRYEYTCQWQIDEPGMPLPMVDFEPGDWVEARNAAGEWEAMRVHAVTVSDQGGTQKAALTLNDRFVDAEVRNAKRMKGIVNGASGDAGTGSAPKGSSDAKPQAPTGLVGQSWGYWADASGFETNTPRAAVQVSWALVTLDVNGLPVALSGYEIDIAGKRATVDASDHEATLEDFACGYTVTVRVRAVSRGGRASDWASMLVPTDYPGLTLDPPTAPELSQSNGIVTIGWDGLLRPGLGAEDYEPPARFDHVRAEAYILVPGQRGTSAWEDAGTLAGAGVLVLDRSDLTDGATVTVRLYAVDRIGGESDPSAVATVQLDFPIRREVAAAQATASGAVDELRADKAELDGKLAEAREDLATLGAAQTALDGRLSDAETDIDAASGRLSSAETQLADSRTRLAEAETRLADARTRLATAESDIVTAQASADAVASDLAAEHTATATALAGLRTDLTGIGGRTSTLENDLDAAEARLATAEGRLSDAESDITDAQSAAAAVAADLADEKTSTASALAGIRSDLTGVAGRTSTLETDLARTEAGLAKAGQDIADLFTLVDGGQNWARNTYDFDQWRCTNTDRISLAADTSGCTVASWIPGSANAVLYSEPRVPYKDLKGKTVTLSAWVHCGSALPTYCRIGVALYADDTTTTDRVKTLNFVPGFVANEWVRYSQTVTLTGSYYDTYDPDTARIGVYVSVASSCAAPLDVKLIKLEIGETMTAWSPHPLDQSDSYAALQQQLAAAEQNITRNAAALTVLNETRLPAVDAAVAHAAAAASEAGTRAQAAQAAADAAAAKTYGQRNMIWNSRWEAGFDHWQVNGNAPYSSIVTDSHGKKWLRCVSREDSSAAQGRMQRSYHAAGQAGLNKVAPEPGAKYTVQALVRGTGRVRLGFAFTDETDAAVGSWNRDVILEDEEKVVFRTETCPEGATGFHVWTGATGRQDETCEIFITDIMLSKGSEVVDWSPAPEDAEEALASLDADMAANQQAIAAAQAAIAANETAIGANQQAISAADSRLDAAEGELDTLTETTLPALSTRISTAQGAAEAAQGDLNQYRTALTTRLAGMDTSISTALTGGVSIDRLFVEQQAVFADAVVETLAAHRLFAEAVLAKTVVVEPSELAPDAALYPALWSLNTRASIEDGVIVLSDNTTSFSQALSPWRDATPGQKYAWSCEIRKSDEDVAGRFSLAIRRTANAGATTSDTNIVDGYGPDYSTEWQRFEGTYTLPSSTTANQIRVMAIRRTSSPATAGHYEIRNISVRPQVGSVLIENGAVGADQVNASEVAAAVGRFLEIDAGVIRSGIIDAKYLDVSDLAAKIATVIELNAEKITTGTLNAELFAAGSIAGGKIAAGTIDVDRLRAATFSADSATARSIVASIASFIELNADRIRTGTLDAKLIGAHTITAVHLNADSFTSRSVDAVEFVGKIASFIELDAGAIRTGTLDAELIGVRTISGDKLEINSIGAEHIVVGGIDATDLIATGTIAGAHVDATSVAAAVGEFLSIKTTQLDVTPIRPGDPDSGKIQAAQLNITGLIQASEMQALKLEAGNITAIQGGFTEAVIENLVADDLFVRRILAQTLVIEPREFAADPALMPDWWSLVRAEIENGIILLSDNTTSYSVARGGWLSVRPGQKLAWSVEVRKSDANVTGTFGIGWQYPNPDRDHGRDGKWWQSEPASFYDTDWQTYTGVFEVPADVSLLRVQVGRRTTSPATTGHYEVRGFTVRPQVGSVLIEDGSIAGEKLVVDSVLADEIIAKGTITASDIDVSGGKITASQLDVAEIVRVADLSAKTISSSQLVADAAGFNAAFVDKLLADTVFARALLAQALAVEPSDAMPEPGKVPGFWTMSDQTPRGDGQKAIAEKASTTASVHYGTVYFFYPVGDGQARSVDGTMMPVVPGATYAWQWRVGNVNAGFSRTIRVLAEEYSQAKKLVASTVLYECVPGQDGGGAGLKKGVWSPANADISWVRVRIVCEAGSDDVGNRCWWDCRMVPQVGSVLIQNGSITGDKIDVDEVLADRIIATGTITASDIDVTDGKITASQLDIPGIVEAAQLNAQHLWAKIATLVTVSASKITVAPTDPQDPDSGKLQASQINVTGVIEAANIRGKEVSASKIVGDTAALNAAFIRQLTGDQAFIDQILTQQISVAPSDYAPSPADSPDWWTLAGNVTIETDTAVPGGRRFRLRETSPTAVEVKGRMRPINAKTEVYVSFWARCSSTMPAGTLTLQYTYRQPGGSTPTDVAYSVPKSGDDAISSTSWRKYETTITVPATASALSIGLRRTSIAASVISDATWYDVHGLTALAKTGSVLIANGAVTADKITVNAALVDKLTAGSLWAGKVTTSMLSATADQKNGAAGVTVSAAGVLARGTAGRVELTANGLQAYNAKTGGTATFKLIASTGAVEMKGTLTSGSTITGATITGSLVRSDTGATRVEMTGNDITFYRDNSGAKRRLILTASDTSSHGGTSGWGHAGMYVYDPAGTYAGRIRGQREAGTNKPIFAMDGPGSSSIWLQNGTGKIAWSSVRGLWVTDALVRLGRTATQYVEMNANGIYLRSGSRGLHIRNDGTTETVIWS